MKIPLLTIGMVLALSAVADNKAATPGCKSGQFTCSIKKPYSVTCCSNGETCGSDAQGKAACEVPAPAPMPATSTRAPSSTLLSKPASIIKR